MTKRWIGLAIAASLCATACKKEEKKGEGATAPSVTADDKAKAEATTGDQKAPPAAGGLGALTAGMSSVAMAKGVDRLLASLPMESEIVLGIDIGRLKQSALLGPIIDQAMAMNSNQMGFDMKAECGLDLAKTMGKVVLGMRIMSAKDFDMSLAMEGMEKGPMIACIEKAKSKIEANGMTVAIDGNVVSMNGTVDGQAVAMAMAFSDDGVGVLRLGKTPPDKAVLQKMVASKVGDGLTGSKEFMGMIGVTNTNATIWGLANGGSPTMQKLPVKFRAAFGSIDITDGVVADGRLRMNSPDEATNLAKLISSQVASVKNMGLADGDALANGSDIMLKFTMQKQQLENVSRMVSGAMQSMTKGLGGGAAPPGP
jgi:hypothetical protein